MRTDGKAGATAAAGAAEGTVDAGASTDDPAEAVELAESLTFGFLRLLDTLGPVERVVFLLADVFDTPYREIATVVGRQPETCRKIASRARARVRTGRVRHDSPDDAVPVAQALLLALAEGAVDKVIALLADDVVLVSDGGAEVYAARRPVVGPDRVARFMVNLARRFLRHCEVELAAINGEPGLVVWLDGEIFLTLSAQVSGGKVAVLHAINNPAKLAALDIHTPIT